MTAILIDYDRIINNDNTLKSFLSNPLPSKRGFHPGLIILIENEVLDTLNSLQLGEQRIKYITSSEFVDNINEHYYIMYNEKKGICLLNTDCEKYLPKILSSLLSGLPKDTILHISIDLSRKDFSSIIDTFVSNGFNNPYITNLCPMYTNISPSIVLTKQNVDSDPDISLVTLYNIMYVIEQYKNNKKLCSLYAKLSPKAIRFLKETTLSEKEMTGELFVKDIVYENEKIVYIIDINKSSVQSGEDENVDVSSTRYNFHSHPKEAYIRHSVEKAWPSVTDYLGYYMLGENTIFHCVSTLEGVYIMSFSSYWSANLKGIDKEFIEENFEINHKESYTPDEYIEKVNSILYKGYPIFELKYFSWDKANTMFSVFFPSFGTSCLPSQEVVDKYKLINN